MKCVTVPCCVIRLATLVLSMLAIGGASVAAETERLKARECGETVEGFSISIATAKAVYEAGERIVLNAQIKNVGKEAAIAFLHPPYGYKLTVLLMDSPWSSALHEYNAAAVPPSGLIRYTLFGGLINSVGSSTGSGLKHKFKPGEARCTEIDLSRVFDMSIHGKYWVSAECIVWSGRATNEPTRAMSNILDVTVSNRPVDRRLPLQSGGPPAAPVVEPAGARPKGS